MHTTRLLLGILLSCGLAGCAKKPDDPLPRAELDLLMSAIQTVNERYVDAGDASMDRLISNSILGMATAIDPYAAIVPAREGMTSAAPETPLMESYKLSGMDVRIIRVFGFEAGLRSEIEALEQEVRPDRPAAILLDARGSYGSDYASAARLLEWFLPAGLASGSVIEKQGAEPRVFISARQELWPGAPLFVLVDRDTFGPAEWLVAALKFHERALLLGEQTRGFAALTSLIPLGADYHLRISTGRALDPAGQPLNDRPLEPSIALTRPPDEPENIDWIYRMGLDHIKETL